MITNSHTETVASMQFQSGMGVAIDEPYITVSSIFSRVQSKAELNDVEKEESPLPNANSSPAQLEQLNSPSLQSIGETNDELLRRSKALSYADEYSSLSNLSLTSSKNDAGTGNVLR